MILYVYEENITPREDISDERSYDTKLLLRGSESDTSLTFPFFSSTRDRKAEEQRKMPLKIFDFRRKPVSSHL